MVTEALATAPPDASVIVPARVARSRCANNAHANSRTHRALRSPAKLRYISPPLLRLGRTEWSDTITIEPRNQYVLAKKANVLLLWSRLALAARKLWILED